MLVFWFSSELVEAGVLALDSSNHNGICSSKFTDLGSPDQTTFPSYESYDLDQMNLAGILSLPC